jgi:hypothetical protein
MKRSDIFFEQSIEETFDVLFEGKEGIQFSFGLLLSTSTHTLPPSSGTAPWIYPAQRLMHQRPSYLEL